MRKAKKELSKGNKIRLVFDFKRQELSSMVPLAEKIAQELYEHVKDVANWETEPTMNGRKMIAFIAPKQS